MSKTYRQYDSRWAKLSYPPGSKYTMSGSGCGPTACAELIVNNPKYKSVTPKDTRKYMINNDYATNGHGTKWDGIPACLKHYGFKAKRVADMDSLWKEMEKPGRRCILLFRGGTRGGITWTASGHYVAASAYKKTGSKHYLYTRDPGVRNNDGWHCYEDTMKGLIKAVWVCWLPEFEVGRTYTLQYKMNVRKGASTRCKKVTTLKKGTKVKCIDISADGEWIECSEGWIRGRGKKVYIK